MNGLLVCAEIFRVILSHIHLSSGKVSSEAEMGHVPNFEILVHLKWDDPLLGLMVLTQSAWREAKGPPFVYFALY